MANITLDATTRSLEIKLAGAVTTNQLHVITSYGDKTSSTFTPGTQLAVTNNTTAVTFLGAPGASTQRIATTINVANRDTAAATVTVQYNDNATIRELVTALVLSAGDILVFDEEGWSVVNNLGQKKTVNTASQSGTWTVQPGNTANTTAWKVDGSAVTQPVSGTVTANAGTNLNTSSLALESTQGTGNTRLGDVTETAPASDTASSGLNGRLQRIAQRLTSLIALLPAALVSGRLDVNLGAAPATVTAQGDVASDGVDGGNPVKIGLQARTSDITAVANADRVNATGDTLGKAQVLLGSLHALRVNGKGNYTNTTAADVIAAQGAGIKTVITSIVVSNAHATVGTKVEIRDGTTVKFQHFAAAAGGGWAVADPGGLLVSTANTAVTARCVTTGADVDVSLTGYTITN